MQDMIYLRLLRNTAISSYNFSNFITADCDLRHHSLWFSDNYWKSACIITMKQDAPEAIISAQLLFKNSFFLAHLVAQS